MTCPPARACIAPDPHSPALTRRVPIAALAAARAPDALATLGLGSCVAIVVYDPAEQVGGLAHVLLPTFGAARDTSNPAKFATTAVPHLLAEMRRLGARGPYVARLVGGATMFAALAAPGAQLGDRNVAAARTALKAHGVTVIGEDVGGDRGRSVHFDLASGRVTVRSLLGSDVVL